MVGWHVYLCQVTMFLGILSTYSYCSKQTVRTCATRHCADVINIAEHARCIELRCPQETHKRWIDNSHFTDMKRWIDTSHYTDLKRRSTESQEEDEIDPAEDINVGLDDTTENQALITWCYTSRCHITNTFKALVACIHSCTRMSDGPEVSFISKKWVDPLNYGLERKRSVYAQFSKCFHSNCSGLDRQDFQSCVRRLCLPQLLNDDENQIEALDHVFGN